jgi:hypothetical protein
VLARRLLLALGGGGSFTVPGYSMSANEVTYWQDLAALLDPEAYVYDIGTSQTTTVDTDECWYLLNGWWLESASGGHWFHRRAHVFDAQPLPAGTVLTTADGTGVSSANGFFYICKPSLVVSGDSRYTDDPRALFFERVHRLQYELEQFQIGATRTDTGTTEVNFPTDFTNGFALHTSAHDVDWLILAESTDVGGINTLNELGDGSDPIRFTGETWVPFVRTDFPSVKVHGGGASEGRAVLTYIKLPGDW